MKGRLSGYVAALAAVALVSAVIAVVLGRTHIANISMLYLIAVLAIAARFGSGPAVLASVAAFLAFDFLFTEPYYTFTVADPTEWIALLLFLATAAVTGQLAAAQRRRAEEASEREREALVLYDVARLLASLDLRAALVTVGERLRTELAIGGIAIETSDPSVGTVTAGNLPFATGAAAAVNSSPAQLLREGSPPTRDTSAGIGRWIGIVPSSSPGLRTRASRGRLFVIPITSGDRRRGTITIAPTRERASFGPIDSRLLAAVAGQIAQALERDRLRREATAAEVLRRSDELKTAVLNAVSHDLRTPLASIIASAGSLRQEDVSWSADDRHEFLATIEHEAGRLNAIIGNLLDLSRMGAGILRPEKGWYDLGALIDDMLGRLRPVTARHVVVVDVPEDLEPLHIDYVEIDEVLTNLVENAVNYTPAGTEIRIAARRAPGEIEVEVSDRGPGIAPDALPRLFEPFYRAADSRHGHRGSGLGLAVAKGLVEAHGGRIWAENRSGGGSRFLFTIPSSSIGEPARV
jgi:two-component system, OmpR family, sensor histidine kinase KdpD